MSKTSPYTPNCNWSAASLPETTGPIPRHPGASYSVISEAGTSPSKRLRTCRSGVCARARRRIVDTCACTSSCSPSRNSECRV